MNTEYLKKMMWQAHYFLKPNTSTSYIHEDFAELAGITDCKEKTTSTIERIEWLASSGTEMLLPIRLSFIQGEMANVSHTGRGARKKVKQMKGHYTKPEISPYKIYSPYLVNTSIWQVDGYKTLYFGSVGINLEEGGGIKDNGDLILFYTTDWEKVGIYIFKGLYNPNDEANLQEVAEYLMNNVVK